MTDFFYNHLEISQLDQSHEDSRMRKATSLMKMLVQALNPYFADSPDAHQDTQLFLSSRNGELEPTVSYLKSYSQKNWARPFLFQNSLHHSTTGFATQCFQFFGPAYSLCAGEYAQQDALFVGILEAIRNQKSSLFIHGECFPEEMTLISEFKAEAFCEVLYIGKSIVETLCIEPHSETEASEIPSTFKSFKSFIENPKSKSSFVINKFLKIKFNESH